MNAQSLFEEADMVWCEFDYRRSFEIGEDFRKLRAFLVWRLSCRQ